MLLRHRQETENLNKVVMRVVSYRPHIVLVEGSITYACQENLQVMFTKPIDT